MPQCGLAADFLHPKSHLQGRQSQQERHCAYKNIWCLLGGTPAGRYWKQEFLLGMPTSWVHHFNPVEMARSDVNYSAHQPSDDSRVMEGGQVVVLQQIGVSPTQASCLYRSLCHSLTLHPQTEKQNLRGQDKGQRPPFTLQLQTLWTARKVEPLAPTNRIRCALHDNKESRTNSRCLILVSWRRFKRDLSVTLKLPKIKNHARHYTVVAGICSCGCH
ncbi:uncharacterized protein LOC112571897 isoform X2 [Pomacea canaliculata]|uniref:uncharacterized protein LOC112571897 isoform X2 n=1 Tax=Pomacea canaliculata TaxID=400727 RepID=UPI000D732F9A|nr:uncharacterized protein LOC112571897 isoform X2 [Pomacea canaliculata]